MELDLQRLKAERIAKGFSQEDMSKAMGWTSRTAYAKRELGLVNIGVNEFTKIINILGYNVEDVNLFFKNNVPKRERL